MFDSPIGVLVFIKKRTQGNKKEMLDVEMIFYDERFS
jgi:hypothetical protein